MVPAWATVAITLGTAVITGAVALVTAVARGRHERDLEHERGRRERALRLHDRRIEVGGNFSTIAHNAISGVRDAVRPGAPPATEQDRERLLQRLHEAEGRAGLVSMHFETKSNAADPEEVIKPLRLAVRKLPVGTASSEASVEVRHEADKADTALKRLNDAMRMILER